MLTIWIIHRNSHHRNALARIAAVGDETVIGGPDDLRFASASPPDAVVLGLSGDFELELEFVHRFGARFPYSAWLLLTAVGDEIQARRLFDTLDADHLNYPARLVDLRRALRAGIQQRRADSLSARHSRDELRSRFGRWFNDLHLPEWMRALDPRMASVPVLVRGEVGTGRELLARYLNTFGGRGEGAFLHVGCRGVQTLNDLVDRFQAVGPGEPGHPTTIWLEDVDRLPAEIQRQLRNWIEFGPLPGDLRGRTVRWMAGASDESEIDVEPGLDPRLAESLAVLGLRIPSLRERGASLERFVNDTIELWCSARDEPPRRFRSDTLALLRTHPWPGNLHELESVVLRTLALAGADPIPPNDLRFPEHSDWLVLDPTAQNAREANPMPASSQESDPSNLETESATPMAGEDELTDLMPQGPPDSRETQGRDILSFFEALDPPSEDSSASIDPVEMATDAALNTVALGSAEDPRDSRDSNLRRMIQSVAHAVRNPLVSIRTFSELLPERYDDPEFRDRFRELVGQDVARIDSAVTRLQSMVDLPSIEPHPVDLAHLLDKLLEEHADEIRSRRLLILKELDHGLPHAYGDPLLLRDALGGLLERAIASVKDRGDIYIASKHHEEGRAGEPSVRVLLRYSLAGGTAPRSASAGSSPGLLGGENLPTIMAQTIVQSLGGAFTSDTTDSDECVVIIDLPAPGPE